jgi:hypothetical protein
MPVAPVVTPRKVGLGLAYVCDLCGADLTRFIRQRSRLGGPLVGQEKRVCRCGGEYSTGRIEWDHCGVEQRGSIFKRTLFSCLVFLAVFAFMGAARSTEGNSLLTAKVVDGFIEGIVVGCGLSAVLWLQLASNVRSSLRRTRRPGGA